MDFSVPLFFHLIDRAARGLRSLQAASRIVAAFFVALGVSGLPLAAHATPSTPNPAIGFTANDGIADVKIGTDGTVYLGGSFTFVGPDVGSAVPLDAGTGETRASYPKVNGTVNVIVSDGGGGWYIGGNFTQVGGVSVANLAHINSDGHLDTGWTPNPNGQVRSLFVDGGVLYVGGQFFSFAGNSIGGASRNYAAALDAATGLATSWNPAPNYIVDAISASGTEVYLGGQFTQVGGTSRQKLASVDNATGALSAWDPGVTGTGVRTIAVSGTLVYVGGSFTAAGGSSRSGLAAIRPDGTADSWNPSPNGAVNEMLLSGSTLYIAGGFSTVGMDARSNLAEVDLATGLATPWDPNVGGTFPEVKRISRTGSTIYFGGQFTTVGGQPRTRLAAVDATTGAPTSWAPSAGSSVLALVADPSFVYVGGASLMVGGVARNYLAAWSPTTTEATAWDPSPDASISEMEIGDGVLYVGGSGLTAIGGQSRSGLAAVDLATGLATGFDASFNETLSDLAYLDGNVYIAGQFTTIGGESRANIARLDGTTGAVDLSWDPSSDGAVYSIAPQGDRVYAAGAFTNIGGAPRTYVAALELVSGAAVSAWNPDVVANSVQVVIPNGDWIYIGGAFEDVNSSGEAMVAALSAADGSTSSTFSPYVSGVNPFFGVEGMALTANSLYAYGQFNSQFGSSDRLAEFHPYTGEVKDWPVSVGFGFVQGVAGTSDRTYVVGDNLGTAHPRFNVFGPGPMVGFGAPTSSGAESVTTVSIPVVLSATSTFDVTVDVTISARTASVDDFSGSGVVPVTIVAGTTSTDATFTVVDDAASESDETVVLGLSHEVQAFLGTPSRMNLRKSGGFLVYRGIFEEF